MNFLYQKRGLVMFRRMLMVGLLVMILSACQATQGQLERFGWVGENPYAAGAGERGENRPSRAEMAHSQIKMQPLPLRDEMNSSNDISSFPVTCRLEDGEARFSKGFSRYDRVEVTVPALGAVRIPLKGRAGRAQLQAEVDATGQQIVFCPVVSAPASAKRVCASVYALPDDFKMGLKRNFSIEGSLHGAVLKCQS